jgi:hypothetical protein
MACGLKWICNPILVTVHQTQKPVEESRAYTLAAFA